MNLYIFRHGETYQTKNKVHYGKRVYDSEILPEGIPAVKKLAEYLKDKKTDANFSSPFLRCRQTVEIVSKMTDKKFIFDNRLSEYVPANETFFSLTKRTKEFYKEMDKKYESVSICTHGYLISAVTQLAMKGRIREEELDRFPNPGVLIEIKKEISKETYFN